MSKVTPFSHKCVEAINEQVNAELSASYAYQAFSIYFNRHDVALYNVASFFKKASEEERQHADKLITYATKRGGLITLKDILAPKQGAVSLVHAFEAALSLEKEVLQKLLHAHECAGQDNEAHFAAYLEEEFLAEQIEAEHQLVGLISVIKRMGSGLGEHLFDKELAENK